MICGAFFGWFVNRSMIYRVYDEGKKICRDHLACQFNLLLATRLDKQVFLCNKGTILVSWCNKELSSWYLAKFRYQVDAYLITIWYPYLFDFILMSWTWKINVKKSSIRRLKCIYLKSFFSGREVMRVHTLFHGLFLTWLKIHQTGWGLFQDCWFWNWLVNPTRQTFSNRYIIVIYLMNFLP
jgi:hypothetical protein